MNAWLLASGLRRSTRWSRIFSLGCVAVGLAIGVPLAAGQESASSEQQQTFPLSSNPIDITVVDSQAVFLADDGEHGQELWITDGVADGTKLLMDSPQGPESLQVKELVTVQQGLAFTSMQQGRIAAYILRSAFLTHNADIRLQSLTTSFLDMRILAVSADRMYFSATTFETGAELWMADLKSNAVGMVLDLWPGPQGAAPGFDGGRAALVGNQLFFVAYWRVENGKGMSEAGLWRTDGTAAGTVFIAPVDPESRNLTALGGKLLFASREPKHGQELWVSDGTELGTHVLADVRAGAGDSSPDEFFANGAVLYFQADDSNHGHELWCSDGTTEGTRLVADIFPGIGSSNPYAFTQSGGRIFFNAKNGDTGIELWVLDEASGAAHLVMDIYRGEVGSKPYQLCDVAGQLFFCADDGGRGEELWISDGTSEGTRLVRDINPGPAFSEPYYLKNLRGVLIFAAADATHGRELWRSDGTNTGTYMVRDIYREPFVNPSSSPRSLVIVKRELFFVANDTEHGAELWVLPTGDNALRLVRDIFPGRASSSPELLMPSGELLLFRADNGQNGPELWRSDGTREGTFMVMDICNGPSGSGPKNFASAGTEEKSNVFFAADDGVHGEELWRTDGQTAALVKDIRPGPLSSSPHEITFRGDGFLFSANDGVHGDELWWTNGSEADTSLIRDILPAPFKGSALRELTPSGPILYFTAEDGTHGRELWSSDGAFAGTRAFSSIRLHDSPAGEKDIEAETR